MFGLTIENHQVNIETDSFLHNLQKLLKLEKRIPFNRFKSAHNLIIQNVTDGGGFTSCSLVFVELLVKL